MIFFQLFCVQINVAMRNEDGKVERGYDEKQENERDGEFLGSPNEQPGGVGKEVAQYEQVKDGREYGGRVYEAKAVSVASEHERHIKDEPSSLPRINDAPRGEGPAGGRDFHFVLVRHIARRYIKYTLIQQNKSKYFFYLKIFRLISMDLA